MRRNDRSVTPVEQSANPDGVVTESRTPRSRIYDGRFYARVLDPFLSGLHGKLAQLVEPGGRVLDVGCGTGNLAFRSDFSGITRLDWTSLFLWSARTDGSTSCGAQL